MNILEQKLAAKFLFPKKLWLETMFTKNSITTEEGLFKRLIKEDFRNVIDHSRLVNLKSILSQDVRVGKLDRPLAVQILAAVNVGVAKRDVEEAGETEEGTGGVNLEEEKKFETKYLDPNLMKEKKKANKEAARLMRLSLTDGLNEIEAIEVERLKNMEHFNIGQKLMLQPPIEVRRGILMLTNANVTYLG